jgi:hypothetical protein
MWMHIELIEVIKKGTKCFCELDCKRVLLNLEREPSCCHGTWDHKITNQGHFEALNDVFWLFDGLGWPWISTNNCTSQLDISNELPCTPNTYCMKTLCHWEVDVSTNHLGPTILLALRLLGLGFWIFRVFGSYGL